MTLVNLFIYRTPASRLPWHRPAAGLCSALFGLALTTAAHGQTVPSANETAAASEVIVTGVRGKTGTVADSPSPIDVIPGSDLANLGGNTTLRDALNALVPSFQVATVGSASWNSLLRPAGFRGLSGAHVLVLVNGKRRHNGALNDLSSAQDAGANPVDIDLIPVSAVDHIEILRDGAAAQYGSDAIAGVLNIILKSADHGGSISTTAGQRYPFEPAHGKIDGQSLQLNADHGFRLGDNGGFLDLAADVRQDRQTDRETPQSGNFYFPVNGKPNPLETQINKAQGVFGLPKFWKFDLSYNAAVPINNDLQVYSFSTYSRRNAWIGQNFRRPNSTNDIPEILPNGFTPWYTLDQNDYQVLAGIKGNLAGWGWDLSSTYGRDTAENGSTHTLNASLGPTSPRQFHTFTAIFQQWTNNFDISRSFDVGLPQPIQVSAGLEHRWEAYQTIAGDPLSYTDGGYIYPSGPLRGQHAAVGAQAAITMTPGDQAYLTRNNFAGYLDIGFNPTEKWYIDLAGRVEHYDDSSGNTVSGKASTRYEIFPGINLRGTVSNGFRAPSLAQEGYAQTSNQYTTVNGVSQYIVSKSVPIGSPIARALGANPLRPELSTSYSVGLTATPIPPLTFAIDPYLIDLNGRIAQTGFLQGKAVDAVLAANGFPSQAVRYFANAINTQTQGVDVTGSYTADLGDAGVLRTTLGFNWNNTKITHVASNPSQLAKANLTLFDRASRGAITVAVPKTKLILGLDWTIDRWRVNLRETRYDQNEYLSDIISADQHFDAVWVTDLEVNYGITQSVNLAVGANNLFNTYPSKNEIPNTTGSLYSPISPFGYYGGFYYLRLSATL